LNSLWYENLNMPSFPTLEEDIETDVLIIGGGICGILCAYMLKKAGADYTLLEADRICRKTTAHTSAKITSQHGLIYSKLIKEFGADAAKKYYEANEAAIAEYARLARDIDCEFRRCDSFIYSTKAKNYISAERDALKKLGIAHEYTDKSELPFSITGAVGFKNQACFNPLKFIKEIARDLNIYENSRVTETVGCTAYTERHRISAKRVIVATHFPFINKHGSYFLKMYQERSYVISLSGATAIEGIYLDEESGGLSIRRSEDQLLIGGSSHRTGKDGCGWDTLLAFRKKYYPDSTVKYKWATQDCITLDGMPYIGRYSKSTSNLYVATGFNKWGMTSSMVAARLLCDMISDKENEYERLFSPSRSILRPKLASNTLEAMRGWLSFGKKRCPHLGCGLTYNKYEHSWDCSCHGSRFDEGGRVLDNPANADIER